MTNLPKELRQCWTTLTVHILLWRIAGGLVLCMVDGRVLLHWVVVVYLGGVGKVRLGWRWCCAFVTMAHLMAATSAAVFIDTVLNWKLLSLALHSTLLVGLHMIRWACGPTKLSMLAFY